MAGKTKASVEPEQTDQTEQTETSEVKVKVVKFNANGGTGKMDDVNVPLGQYTLPESTFTPPSGKQFKQWAESANGKTNPRNAGTKITFGLEGEITFYAIWEDIPKKEESKPETGVSGSGTAGKPSQPAAGDISSITTILENGSLSNEKKIEAIVNSGVEAVSFVKNPMSYQNELSINAVGVTDVQGASKNRILFYKLLQVLDTEDYTTFKIKFDVVNLVFLTYNDDAFNEFRLHRFDLKWTGGTTELKTYQKLVTVISALCDKSKRAEQLKTISLSKMVDANTTVFSETNRRNLLQYYQA